MDGHTTKLQCVCKFLCFLCVCVCVSRETEMWSMKMSSVTDCGPSPFSIFPRVNGNVKNDTVSTTRWPPSSSQREDWRRLYRIKDYELRHCCMQQYESGHRLNGNITRKKEKKKKKRRHIHKRRPFLCCVTKVIQGG